MAEKGPGSPASQTENRDRVVNNPLRLTSARAHARRGLEVSGAEFIVRRFPSRDPAR